MRICVEIMRISFCALYVLLYVLLLHCHLEKGTAMKKASYQVKANGYRTRTYSFSNMGFDNAISYACYLVECENATNVRFVENKPDGSTIERTGKENLLSMM